MLFRSKIGRYQIVKIEEVIARNPAIACKQSCTYCCNLRVVALPHELISIYLHIRLTFPKQKVAEIEERLEAQYARIKDMTIDEHFMTNIQCPLLVEGSCSVYSVRPIACAGYHSASVEACKQSDENPEIVGFESGGIPMDAEVQEIVAMHQTVIDAVVNSEGDDAGKYELIKGLLTIFRTPTVNQNWLRGRKYLPFQAG